MKLKLSLLFVILFVTANTTFAQYFVTGSTSNSVRWNQLKDGDKRVVYPDYFYPKATIIEGYLDSVRSVITYGLDSNIEYIPIILHPKQVRANGLVTWTPRRMELYTSPSDDLGSLPWLKQLAVHEYRHVVQMSNLNVGFTKVLGYLIGEQAVGAVTIAVPGWFFEGDAVLAETQLSINGRGKQPEFSINHRAMLNEAPETSRYDKWKGSSMNTPYPSMYEMGYWPALAGQTFYDPYIWDNMMNYCGRNPIVAFFYDRSLKKKYGKTSTEIVYETYERLDDFWRDASNEPNSSAFIPNSYELYEKQTNPIMLDSTTILTYGYNMNTPHSMFQTDIENGERRVVENSVFLSSPQIVKGDNVYWTEYKQSLFWEQESESLIRTAKIVRKDDKIEFKEHQYIRNGDDNVYHITSIDHLNQFAYISYDMLQNPSLVVVDSAFVEVSRADFEGWDTSINSMSYDNLTKRLYLFVLNNDGVSLQSFDLVSGCFSVVKSPSHVAQRQMSARDGKLYFTSTASGKDENHVYDLTSGREWQTTSSQYGSFYPTPVFEYQGDSIQMVSSYRRMGYSLAKQRVNRDSLKEVAIEYMPNTRLHPSWYEWDNMKIDTINITPDSSAVNLSRVKPFRKLAHMFNPHSWVPFTIDVDKLINERQIYIGVGATVMSQNLLGDMITTLGYGYVPKNKMSLLTSSLSYTGLPVHFDVNINYGGMEQGRYFSGDIHSYYSNKLDKDLSVKAIASLPINLSNGKYSKSLNPYIQYNYTNALKISEVHDDRVVISEGINKATFGVSWQKYKYKGVRDLESPLGYAVSLSSSLDPFSDDFGKVYSLYGSLSLPGLCASHSTIVRANVQYQQQGRYNFMQASIYPRGNDLIYSPRNLYAFAGEYKFPLAFPDGGIRHLLYLKRISLGLFGEYAYNRYFTSKGTSLIQPYTYGMELMFDYTVFSAATQLFTGISIFKPSESDKLMFGFSFNVAF